MYVELRTIQRKSCSETETKLVEQKVDNGRQHRTKIQLKIYVTD